MSDGKIKVYTYTRVSTAMQVDGYSLDAQKARMKAFAEFNGYEDRRRIWGRWKVRQIHWRPRSVQSNDRGYQVG
jgi:DNA invertase Pin-like site-specific DNA recombinase